MNNKIFVRILFFSILIFNSFHAAAIYRLRMIEDDKMVYWFPFISEDEQKLAKYLFWDYGHAIKKIENFIPVLRKHNIDRQDFVLSIPDQSFNISLYFLDQKGFPISKEHFMLDTTVTDHFKAKNIKYLVLSDTTLKQQISFKRMAPFLTFYFQSDGVEVFKISPSF